MGLTAACANTRNISLPHVRPNVWKSRVLSICTTIISNTNTKTMDMHRSIGTPNTFTDDFYELITSVMPNGLGTIRNHRGTTVAYL